MDEPLGKPYADGEVICRQGEIGDRMFVVQSGTVVVAREDDGIEVTLGELEAGDLFGEMAIFDRQPRSATVRAKRNARVLTLDKRGFVKRVHEDPSLAYRLLRDLSRRVRALDSQLSGLRRAARPTSACLLVVSRDHPELHRRLTDDFTDDPAVEVVLDRRTGERPDCAASDHPERRETARRGQSDDALLRAHGLIVVRSRRNLA